MEKGRVRASPALPLAPSSGSMSLAALIGSDYFCLGRTDKTIRNFIKQNLCGIWPHDYRAMSSKPKTQNLGKTKKKPVPTAKGP